MDFLSFAPKFGIWTVSKASAYVKNITSYALHESQIMHKQVLPISYELHFT